MFKHLAFITAGVLIPPVGVFALALYALAAVGSLVKWVRS